MTTAIKIDAHAGWDVEVAHIGEGSVHKEIVQKGTEQTVYCYGDRALLIRELRGDGSPMPMQTKGQYRVGISFNPSHDSNVDTLKAAAATLIDMIEQIPTPGDDSAGEVERLKALAMTDVEAAAMWAVKATTKPPRT